MLGWFLLTTYVNNSNIKTATLKLNKNFFLCQFAIQDKNENHTTRSPDHGRVPGCHGDQPRKLVHNICSQK